MPLSYIFNTTEFGTSFAHSVQSSSPSTSVPTTPAPLLLRTLYSSAATRSWKPASGQSSGPFALTPLTPVHGSSAGPNRSEPLPTARGGSWGAPSWPGTREAWEQTGSEAKDGADHGRWQVTAEKESILVMEERQMSRPTSRRCTWGTTGWSASALTREGCGVNPPGGSIPAHKGHGSDEEQHAFTRGKLCPRSLRWLCRQKRAVPVVYLDFQKAFDIISGLLITKLVK